MRFEARKKIDLICSMITNLSLEYGRHAESIESEILSKTELILELILISDYVYFITNYLYKIPYSMLWTNEKNSIVPKLQFYV